ncbi:PIN domain-containing protein [Longimicrobium sp.]|uniref:PIN domain-containing protein n=1 Tax=Longimicrobium sp. TaxID=2029185 RepID=UPI002E337E25|nr:PIN domain-containing protein [Longimicrobium sp.]HEX6037071.1 PIN domain-containing protein [Longimicrobium sp.]
MIPNILFSALLRQENRFTAALLGIEHRFFVCESVLVELFKHKEKILRASRLTDDELVRVYHVLLRRVTLFKEDLISREHLKIAEDLCRGIDEADTPHVALALELDAPLWTGDTRLRDGLMARGFNRFFSPD